MDDSKASMRALRYVAKVIDGRKDFAVCLFHVLGPLPPELMEFPGSEDPECEEKMDTAVKFKQDQWIERAKKKALPVVNVAKAVLNKARIPTEAIDVEFWVDVTTDGLPADILHAARQKKCDTVAVGRKSFSWLKEIFHHHVADELVQSARNVTVWVVE